jgi:lipid II isoglutaminyl synthase (glutamine-hydrolysing)
MTMPKITIGHLYPEVMNTRGDRGNISAIVRRCAWRGITAEVSELRMGDPLRADDVDLLMIGDGGESDQDLVAADLVIVKGPAIKDAVARGAAALAIGGGYELFGRYCQPARGPGLPGLGLFDSWTVRSVAEVEVDGPATQARADRVVGDLVVRWDDELLVGFEDHAGRTYLGPSARPLGSVLAGRGNNGDGGEGVLLGGVIGTYLRGPCLPRNPALADVLIRAAVSSRYGAADLAPLPDNLERTAHDRALDRVLAAQPARRARAGWPRRELGHGGDRRHGQVKTRTGLA